MPDKVFIRNVPDDLWRAFKARASLEGLTLSQAIGIAIRGYLRGSTEADPNSDPFAGIVALGSSGYDDVSEHHDEHIAQAAEARGEYGDGDDPR